MRFDQPIWLLAGLAIMAMLFVIFLRFDSRQRAALAEFASNHLLYRLTTSFSPLRRRVKRLLFSSAVLFVCIALARPQIGYHWEDEKQRGIDILFAIDTSKSMLTQDVTPDRLSRAKLAIIDFIRQLGTDRVGLIAFAGDAFLQAPLTLDYDAFAESLDAIDTNVIPRGGTDVASAIREAEVAFGSETKNKKILVLITDGEDLEAKGIEAAKAAAAQGLTIYTVGVGSSNGGLIPVPGTTGGTEFVKDASGQFVKSHLDESTLKQIAEATGGIYEPLGQHGEGLDKLYREALATLPKQDVTSRREKVYDDRFQWPLAVGIALLLASMFIGTRRRDEKPDALAEKAVRRVVTAGVMALLVMGSNANASPQSAEKAYKHGDFDDAEEQYEQAAQDRPTDASYQFNLGTAAFKANDYDKALPSFQKSLQTDHVELQQQSYYNLGNTQYRVGEQSETSAPDDSLKRWQEAVQSYNAALNLKPDDADAKFNRDFVQKKLDRLQKQQQQKKDQQKKDDQKKDGDDKTEPKNNQGNQNTQSPDKNQQGKSSPDQKGDQSKGQGSQSQNDKGGGQQPDQNQQGNQANGKQPGQDQQGSQANGQQSGQGQQGNQANGQQPGQNPNDQANAQKPGSQQGQNGQPDQQNPGGQPDDKQGNQQANGNQGKPSQDKGQQPGDKGDGQNSQVAQNQNAKPGQGGGGTPDKNGTDQQTGSTVGESGTPGVLSREEAKELLNSLKNGEHALPVTADARSTNHAQSDAPLKDW